MSMRQKMIKWSNVWSVRWGRDYCRWEGRCCSMRVTMQCRWINMLRYFSRLFKKLQRSVSNVKRVGSPSDLRRFFFHVQMWKMHFLFPWLWIAPVDVACTHQLGETHWLWWVPELVVSDHQMTVAEHYQWQMYRLSLIWIYCGWWHELGLARRD